MTLSYARTIELPDPRLRPDVYAAVPMKRAIAWAIDNVLILAVTLLAVVATGLVTVLILPAIWFTVAVIYRGWSLSTRSATPGMRFLEIELRNGHGAPLTPAEAWIHTVLYLIAWAMMLPQIASAVLMLVTDRGQGLPDLALGTTAINRASR